MKRRRRRRKRGGRGWGAKPKTREHLKRHDRGRSGASNCTAGSVNWVSCRDCSPSLPRVVSAVRMSRFVVYSFLLSCVLGGGCLLLEAAPGTAIIETARQAARSQSWNGTAVRNDCISAIGRRRHWLLPFMAVFPPRLSRKIKKKEGGSRRGSSIRPTGTSAMNGRVGTTRSLRDRSRLSRLVRR